MRTFLQFPPGPAVACALCLVVPDQNDLKLSTVGLVVLDSARKLVILGSKELKGSQSIRYRQPNRQETQLLLTNRATV